MSSLRIGLVYKLVNILESEAFRGGEGDGRMMRLWKDAINKEQTFCRKNALLWAPRKKVCSLYRVSGFGCGCAYPVTERRSGRVRA